MRLCECFQRELGELGWDNHSPWKLLRATKKDLAGHIWPPGLEFDPYVLNCRATTRQESCQERLRSTEFCSVFSSGLQYVPLLCVRRCQQIGWFHLLSLHLHAPPLVCSSATVYGLWCTVQQAPEAPIISIAHVFEEVEVFQLNAKQDLLGLSPGLRHFIADSVSQLVAWKFSPLEI